MYVTWLLKGVPNEFWSLAWRFSFSSAFFPAIHADVAYVDVVVVVATYCIFCFGSENSSHSSEVQWRDQVLWPVSYSLKRPIKLFPRANVVAQRKRQRKLGKNGNWQQSRQMVLFQFGYCLHLLGWQKNTESPGNDIKEGSSIFLQAGLTLNRVPFLHCIVDHRQRSETLLVRTWHYEKSSRDRCSQRNIMVNWWTWEHKRTEGQMKGLHVRYM